MGSTEANSSNVSVKVFLKCLKQSQLLADADYQQVAEEFRAAVSAGKLENGGQVARELVKRGMLTRWQADKLLQGKHRSFQLGKYRLLGVVGKGGMSTVYLAEHRVMKRRCALKVLPSKRVRDSSWLGRFQREAQVGGLLDHPNIIRTYDIDSVQQGDAEVHFIVMEYIDGEDLKRIVERDGPFDQALAADFIRQACEGLHHAHVGGLVHRDIKPANLLLEANGTIRLMDLGLVTALENEDQSLTRAHNERVIGTADYLSPEQALDSHTVDGRADLYGLGCTLYFLLTGRPPFDSGSLAQRILAHQTKQPQPLSEQVENMSAELEAIVRRMMAKKPADRFQTAEELATELTGWLIQHGTEEWKQKHAGLQPAAASATAESAAGDQSAAVDAIPVAKPVIPSMEFSAPESVASEPDTSEPGNVDVLDLSGIPDAPVAAPIADLKVDDSITSSRARRGGSQDRWLMGVAIAMLVGLAALVVVAVVKLL